MKQEYVNTIMELGKSLPPEARAKFASKCGISEPTLTKYLSGDIKKFHVADKIILELTRRLEGVKDIVQ